MHAAPIMKVGFQLDSRAVSHEASLMKHAERVILRADPIFIIGTERSGSNLLRLILNAHSGIAVPHPPHIFQYFSKLESSYGDLEQAAPMNRLVDDVLTLLDTHIYPWEIKISPEKFNQDVEPRNLLGVFAGIYDEYLNHSGKRRWGCKSTFMIHHTDCILKSYPDARFILLVRDPRDVAASSRQSVFSPFHPYFTALLWRDQQLEGLKLMKSLPRENIMLLQYEELIENPEPVIRNICDFLEEEFEPGILDFYKTPSALKSGKLSKSWQNASSPIISDNKNKYRRKLSKYEIQLIEGVAGGVMNQFGYELDFPENLQEQDGMNGSPAKRISFLRRLWFRLLDRIWFLKIEGRSLLSDSNHWLRWRRAFFLKKLSVSFRMKGLLSPKGLL